MPDAPIKEFQLIAENNGWKYVDGEFEQEVGRYCPWCLDPGEKCSCDETKRREIVYVDADGYLCFKGGPGSDPPEINLDGWDVRYI